MGKFSFTEIPIECAKCVLPKPTPPYINNGLNAVPPGLFETAKPEARANLLHSPSTKLSKVKAGIRLDSMFNFFSPGITNGLRICFSLPLIGTFTGEFFKEFELCAGILTV